MSINLKIPDIRELKPRITVFGVGGAGGNALNNMIDAGLQGVDFVVANTDAQALTMSRAERIIQLGVTATEGLGAGSQPDVGRAAAEAMMGTGEASGDKRALRSAEAAISNPLIDDVSMRGARGLLISITGGKVLTLYEVDEAATRIREEVDVDANIIVGATFDESLDGIVRVSVVATEIDVAIPVQQPVRVASQSIAMPAPQAVAAASRLAELTQSLRVS